ncbi:hypothetical protein H0H92_015415 [Tricholoma furcatifolium]|nr:hypothetical protein H0H92_015415 [Tricholoma furcatifolium]
MPRTRIFITGATGFVGRAVTALAVARGYEVHALSRHESGDNTLISLGAIPVRGDLTTHDILSRESSTADIVLHCAFDRATTRPYGELVQMDIEAVDALAQPLVGTNKPLIVSSGVLLVLPDPNGGETDETAPYNENSPMKRYLCEKHALGWAARDVRVSAIRLPLVYGRGDEAGFLSSMIKLALKAGESAYIDDGANTLPNIHVDDLASLYLAMAEKAKAGEIFNATTRWDTTYKDMTSAVGTVAQVPVRSITKEEAVKRWGPFRATIATIESKAVNRKAVEVLGWKPVGPHILQEIEEGYYQAALETFKSEQ